MTPRQRQCLDAIERLTTPDGVSPSYDEIGAAIGNVKSGVHRLVEALIRDGHVVKVPAAQRCLRVVKPLDKAVATLIASYGLPAVSAALSRVEAS